MRLFRWRKKTPDPTPVAPPPVAEAPVAKAPAPPPVTEPEPDPLTVRAEPHPDRGRDPGIDAAVALNILDVGDLLENADIRLRLAEALAELPDVEVLTPQPGDPFDRSRHRWESTEPTTDPTAVETVAYLISAGLTDGDGLLLRPARVAVYDTEEG